MMLSGVTRVSLIEGTEDLVRVLVGLRESVCDGKKNRKPWRTSDGSKKFAVCVDGKVVRFGDPNLEIKRDSDSRRKNFRARHNCDNPGPATKARYWSCKNWEKDRSVSDVVEDRTPLRLLERKDLIPGGLADDSDPSDFDQNQLAMGTKVEREHTNSDEKAREIAMDHLKEDPRYYTKLKLIEPHHDTDKMPSDSFMSVNKGLERGPLNLTK